MAVASGNIILTQADNLTFNPQRCAFTKTFPRTYISNGDRISLLNASMYYSWQNLTAAYNNLTGLSYIFNGTTYPVVFVPGCYASFEALSDYIQSIMFSNGHYLLDNSGSPVYFLSLITNVVLYGCSLKCNPIPTSLPAGWSNPNSIALSGNCPQLVVSGSTSFQSLIGYAPGTYPTTPLTSSCSFNSTIIPVIAPVASVMILCNWVNDDRFTLFPSVIGSFSPATGYGTLLSITPPVITMYPVSPNTYNSIEIRLVDQNYNPLQILDTSQTSFSLLIQSQK
jgi:hypothetical protein